MKTIRELDRILAELGREHRRIDAPQTIEAALHAAADRRKDLSGVRKARWTRVAAAAAAIVLVAITTGGAVSRLRNAHRQQESPVRPVSRGAVLTRALSTRPALPERQPLAPAQIVEHKHTVAAVSTPVRAARAKHGPRFHETPANLQEASSAKLAPANSLDEFVPLPISEGLPPAAELNVVRIRLRGSDLRQYGLEAPAEAAARTMSAEFVVGEDGLPRAIRIVRSALSSQR